MKINKDDLGFVYSIYQKIRYWRIKRIHEKIVTGMVWKLVLEDDKTKIEKAFSYG